MDRLVAVQPLVLAQDLHPDRALARDHVGVVERMDETETVRLLQFERMRIRVRIAFAEQHDIGAARLHRIDLHLGRRHRHHDHGPAAEALRRQRDALRVIAGRRRDHAARELGLRQPRHLVVRAAQLEAEDRLVVLALQQHGVADAPRQRRCDLELRLARHVVDARVQDPLQVIDGHAARSSSWRFGARL